MSKVIAEYNEIKAVADEIRSLSGTTEGLKLTGMNNKLSDANDEVAEQADLISQISAVLDGKAGGSGVSVETTDIVINNKIGGTSPLTISYSTLNSNNEIIMERINQIKENIIIKSVIGSHIVLYHPIAKANVSPYSYTANNGNLYVIEVEESLSEITISEYSSGGLEL